MLKAQKLPCCDKVTLVTVYHIKTEFFTLSKMYFQRFFTVFSMIFFIFCNLLNRGAMALLSPFGGMLYWHWLQCPSVKFVQHTTQSIFNSVSLSDLKKFFGNIMFGF